MRGFSLFVLILGSALQIAADGPIADDAPQKDQHDRYPNELIGYRLFQGAKWSQLTPLESTIADVRRVLGAPADPRDIANYMAPYPGDNAARQPVFSYRLDARWEAVVYFGRHCVWLPSDLREILADRVCSIELIPSKGPSFRNITFPPAFHKQHVDAADAAWDEYADGSGLVYEVYTTRTPYGAAVPGDLNRIVYGPSAAQITKRRDAKR